MKQVHEAPESLFWYWINERHQIYLRKEAKRPKPWTTDPILRDYKFTNVFRELDKTTKWMRKYLTGYNDGARSDRMIFNCCVFRLFGTIEMSDAIGWIDNWRPKEVIDIAKSRLERGEKVFTGAYIVTNGGLREPKVDVVVNRYLTPIWTHREKIASVAYDKSTLYDTWNELHKYPGFGGGGFMAYEVVSDLRWTRVLKLARDKMTWANAGPGCLRGLRRLFPDMKKFASNSTMMKLLERSRKNIKDYVPQMEMRDIEHSLCEFDKYCRVKFGEGTPRSRYNGGA